MTTLTRDTTEDIAGHDSLIDANTLYNITDDTDVSLKLLQTIYPVGAIYIGTMNICPLSALFGTWELLGEEIDNCVIETYTNGTNGYRIWQDGYCEQWGQSTSDGETVTFLKKFKDTNYTIAGMAQETDTGAISSVAYLSPTATSIVLYGKRVNAAGFASGAHPVFWKASGYLASGQYTPKTTAFKKFIRTA